jgi:hypothetical protein
LSLVDRSRRIGFDSGAVGFQNLMNKPLSR